jgi:PAS domain S-box-containing protein
VHRARCDTPMTDDSSLQPDDAERHRRLVDLASDILFVADLDGRLAYVNDAATRSLHLAAADLVGREALSLVREDARDEARAFYMRQLERKLSDTYFELPLQTRGQATLWVGLHLRLVVADGQPSRFEGAARDVTDRRRVEDALQQSDERYRQAFDENLAGIFVASPNGQIRSCNPAFVQICGFPSLADALGANLGALYPDGGALSTQTAAWPPWSSGCAATAPYGSTRARWRASMAASSRSSRAWSDASTPTAS